MALNSLIVLWIGKHELWVVLESIYGYFIMIHLFITASSILLHFLRKTEWIFDQMFQQPTLFIIVPLDTKNSSDARRAFQRTLRLKFCRSEIVTTTRMGKGCRAIISPGRKQLILSCCNLDSSKACGCVLFVHYPWNIEDACIGQDCATALDFCSAGKKNLRIKKTTSKTWRFRRFCPI